jgi:SAM-dependent methyltransferase
MPHGFTNVDEQPSPAAWVTCLDTLGREPFYQEYKAMLRQLLAPTGSERYVDVGVGVGTDALRMGARVIGIDRSLTMCRTCRFRGLTLVAVADAVALPLRNNVADGCWSDRTFQHLEDPMRALTELVRVARPGAPIVVVDPDYSTQVMECADRELATKVLDFRAHHALRHGTLGHRMAGMFVDVGLERVEVAAKVLLVRDPTSVDHVMGLRSWAAAACAAGFITESDVRRWELLFDQTAARGKFLWAVTFFMTSGRKRGGRDAV